MRSDSAGSYHGTIQPGWDIAGAADGGYLLAMLTHAVLAETGRADPLTVTGHFLSRGRPGAVCAAVEVLRSGRRFTTAAARLSDGSGSPLLTALATVGEHDGHAGPSLLVDGRPPDLPAPPDCLPVEPTNTFPPPFMGKVRLRLHPEDIGFFAGSPSGAALMRGWFELPDEEPLSSTVVLLAADSFPPPVFNAALPISWTPTVELTVHVRARPSGPRLACVFRTRFVTAGYLDIDGELWDSDGRLVALSRQLALVPRG
jgi:hypothetical protein